MCKGIFGKIIVCVCLVEMAIVQMWAMWIADKTGEQMTALVSANHGVFGGELLLLCVKRICTEAKSENIEKVESIKNV